MDRSLTPVTQNRPEIKKEPAIPFILFDRRDYELIRIVKGVCCGAPDLAYTRRQYYGHFHPHGIKEMAESRSLRIAFSMVHLLTSLESGGVDERLGALRSLKAEVLDTAEGPLPKNSARVMLQIMKELVRVRDNFRKQLELAHDFRLTASGKPRRVRRQLRRYHLLEMPEAWNQIAFDDHVHDVNTKGRKSSTHLMMDAWIKGIRRLRVIHYNYIEPRFAAELLEAARILEIDVRIGIEFSARYRDKYVQLIWVPRGFTDAQAFLCFLEEDAVTALMEEGRKVSAYQQAYVMALLEAVNREHLGTVNRALDISLPPVDTASFLDFVGIGQKSLLHLETFIHQKVTEALCARADALRSEYNTAEECDREDIRRWFDRIRGTDVEAFIKECLKPEANPSIPNPSFPREDVAVPALLQLTPSSLLERLAGLSSGYRITLNLTNVEIDEVLELIYDTEGKIRRLEIFNLKDWAEGKTEHIPAISRLQAAVNEESPIALKKLIQEILEQVKSGNRSDRASRVDKITAILHDIISLQAMYRGRPLKARIGSDSTGRALRSHGMGLAVIETLPHRARRQIRRDLSAGRRTIPIHIRVYRRTTEIPRLDSNRTHSRLSKMAGALPGFRSIAFRFVNDWAVQSDGTQMADEGNVVTLGGARSDGENGIVLEVPGLDEKKSFISWTYLNSHLKNFVKVGVGFIPAFATFALTKDWWLLAYLGAFIWFGITGVRNILQSVLGGGGLRRSALLRWNAYVSWDRIADSLLFTGFSVPLLDYLTKTVFLDRGLGITTTTNPLLLYTFMALINGIYLSTHNAFRGLPRGAVFGNFFRSVLSIPVAVLFNWIAGGIMSISAVPAVDVELQKWAAIISKAASDLVAGVIEGAADRYHNIRLRYREYLQKLTEILDIYAHLELLFPDTRALEVLQATKSEQQLKNAEARDMERIIAIHALDLLYFWHYQPRAQSALVQLLSSLNEEERHILVTSQFTLLRKRDISQMFIDGVVGSDFARPLAFYLARYEDYLNGVKRFA